MRALESRLRDQLARLERVATHRAVLAPLGYVPTDHELRHSLYESCPCPCWVEVRVCLSGVFRKCWWFACDLPPGGAGHVGEHLLDTLSYALVKEQVDYGGEAWLIN